MPFRTIRPVRKAVDPAGRTSRTLTAQERRIVEAFLQAASALETSVDSALIQQLISQGSASALGSLDTGGFITALEPMVQAIQAQVVAGGQLGMDGLPTSIQGAYRFDALDPRAIAWAQTRAGELIVQITDEQRAVLNRVLARSVENGWTVQQTTQDLRQVIGLHDRWATAVQSAWDRDYERLLRTGMSESLARQQANALADRYRQRLLTARATNIARTEILTAANQGRWLSWAQGVEGGYISDTATKRWTTGPLVTSSPSRRQVCDICAGVRGEEVPWNAPFSNGRMMPPAHPSCRCSAELVPESIESIRQRLRDTDRPTSGSEIDELRSRIDPARQRAQQLADEATKDLGLLQTLTERDGLGWRTTATGRELNDSLISVGREVRELAERRAGTRLASLRDDVAQAQARKKVQSDLWDIKRAEIEAAERRAWERAAQEQFGRPYDELGFSQKWSIRQNIDLHQVDDWKRIAEQMDEIKALHREAVRAYEEAVRTLAVAEREALLDIMGELRAVGSGDNLSFTVKARSGKSLDAQLAIREAAEVYPQEWVSLVEQRTLAHKVVNRGYAVDGGTLKPTEIALSSTRAGAKVGSTSYYRCAVHEMSHVMEYVNARIRAAEHSFYWQRCQGEGLVRLAGGGSGRRDQWYDVYVGRDYGGGVTSNYEVLTMGMEHLFGGSTIQTPMDQAYRDWVLGVWLSL